MPLQRRNPKLPRGRASDWSAEQIAAISDAQTPEAQSAAQQAWRRHAPRAFRSLLDAEPVERRGDDPALAFDDAT